jgi:hypothetical protein
MVQALRYNSGYVTLPPLQECYNLTGSSRHGSHSPARLFSMFRSRPIAILLLALGLSPALLWSAPQKTQKPHTVRVKAAAKPVVEPVAPPAPPVPPPTPEQLPAQPPQVSYLNGQLTIISRNSTLADILHAVARQTGAAIELPPGAGFERVAGRMGPGPARNVLAELLNGSRYDYVMVASAANPGGLRHVILTPKTGGGEGPSSAPPVAAYQPPPQPEQQVMPNEQEMPPDASADESEIPPEEPPADDQSSQQPPQAPPGQAYPQAYTPGTPQSGSVQPGAQQPAGVKTPEQLLQELQRMQQLQQQQQQQQQPQQQQ